MNPVEDLARILEGDLSEEIVLKKKDGLDQVIKGKVSRIPKEYSDGNIQVIDNIIIVTISKNYDILFKNKKIDYIMYNNFSYDFIKYYEQESSITFEARLKQ